MVKRYELKADYDCGEMVPLSDGTYVLYSDYAHLEALIADAPHSSECWAGMLVGDGPQTWKCNCWKYRALDTGAKG